MGLNGVLVAADVIAVDGGAVVESPTDAVVRKLWTVTAVFEPAETQRRLLSLHYRSIVSFYI